MISLLPYLQGNIFLKLALESSDESGRAERPYAFRVVADSNPFSRVVELLVMTGAGTVVKSLFLLMQKDKYGVGTSTLRPITNRDVEEAWRSAASPPSDRTYDELLTFFGEADGVAPGPILFQPLFFCKGRQVFFRPVCPDCGTHLDLCTDDNLLAAQQLPAYSASLQRVLYCRSCAASQPLTFFYSYDVDESGYRPNLKDRWGLIEDYSRSIVGGGVRGDLLPCIACSRSEPCFGMNREVRSMISFFSFYPFFGLVREALTVSALDYLALVSGASASELESPMGLSRSTGRARVLQTLKDRERAGLLFENETGDRRFLEVLHLKLCLLEDLFAILGSQVESPPESESLKMLGLGTSLEDVWVGLWDVSRSVPLLWSYKVRVIDTVGSFSGVSGVPGSASFYKLMSLGVIWFCALIVNKRQGIHAVHTLLNELLAASAGTDALFQGEGEEGIHPGLGVENIFWNPSNATVGADVLPLWHRALNLGWSLVVSGYRHGRGWSEEAFRDELVSLRGAVKEMLFSQGGLPRREEGPATSDPEIRHLLSALRAKWQAELPKETVPPVEVSEDETLIFSPTDRASFPETTEGPSAEDSLPETLIVEAEDQEVEETIVITADEWEAGRPSVEAVYETGELPETIVLSGIPGPGADAVRHEPEAEEARDVAPEDKMDETLVFSPSDAGPKDFPAGGTGEVEEIPETLPVGPHGAKPVDADRSERSSGPDAIPVTERQWRLKPPPPEQIRKEVAEPEEFPVTERRWPVMPPAPEEPPKEDSQDEESLDETIILTPKRATDKDKGRKQDS